MEAIEKLTAEKPESETAEVFDPQAELERVKKLPKEERPETLKEYKEKLARQKEGIAKMQAAFIEVIRNNPDIPMDVLDQKLEEFGKELKLSLYQKAFATAVLEIYTKKHQAIKKIREQYPDDTELFGALFGQSPKGRVEIIQGPITLYIRCHNTEDFALIRTKAFKTKRLVSREELDIASMAGGVSIESSLIPGLEGTITAENVHGGKFNERIFKHEEQHALNRWFKKETQRRTYYIGELARKLKRAKTDEEREFSLKRHLRVIRQSKLESAKGEILAYSKEGRNIINIINILTTPAEKGGLYDYFADEKDFWRAYFRIYFIMNSEHKQEKLIERSIKDVFESEYYELLKSGLLAFFALRSKGFSTDQAIALLISEPLEKWPKVVRRIIEERRKKNDDNN